ncbi:MAG: small multi-drug export protein [Nitriliruptoraceae bacterium]
MELAFDGGSWWTYLLVFLAAAIPVIEVLVVIPAAILAGLSPVPVLLLAVAGNLTTVALVVVAGDRLAAWWRARRQRTRAGSPASSERPRTVRARQLARRWGVPGLGLLGPLTTGSHLAAVAALATGAGQRRVLVWMATGLVVWGVVVATATSAGLAWFG